MKGPTPGSNCTVMRGPTPGSNCTVMRGPTPGSNCTVMRGPTPGSNCTVMRGPTPGSNCVVHDLVSAFIFLQGSILQHTTYTFSAYKRTIKITAALTPTLSSISRLIQILMHRLRSHLRLSPPIVFDKTDHYDNFTHAYFGMVGGLGGDYGAGALATLRYSTYPPECFGISTKLF
ncbi:hypothetical protein K505DRAFT_366313 [Melanomma pulvis-pyrius CBS 109.77]|uniref:Uncharacterized protein n=1 Tax=Melanomma pulvis-pyrius CBS 109.77 TaxID=1314802 RepID=A0A6A6WWZ3_9PLEO|nr:hypothetical protein K505DRAFT_366313 [Melanomma pulvis-pyrius CBS 109.77]